MARHDSSFVTLATVFRRLLKEDDDGSNVKIGDTIVNMDLVTQAYFKPGSVRLYFAAATGKGDDRHLDVVEFFGRDATALRSFLEANCDDVLKLAPPAD